MISIVIPVRNGAAYIAEAVSSARAQGRMVREVIVVDDGSTDGSGDIARASGDGRITVIAPPASGRGGVSAARNAGLARASGDWILFLDADDRLRPGALAALLAGLDPATDVAVYGDYDRIDAKGALIGRRGYLRRRQKPQGQVLQPLLAGNFIVNGGIMLIRRAAFRALGGFDEALRYCEDWHAWCRLAATGPFAFAGGARVLDYRVHDRSVMMGKALTLDDYRPALEAIYADPAILAALGDTPVAPLRKAAEAHLSAYLVAQSLRAGRYPAALAGLLRTLVSYPGRSHRTILTSGAAMVGL